MGLSRNKVAVPEGAAGSPPFYGVFLRTPVWRPSCGPCAGNGFRSCVGVLVWKRSLASRVPLGACGQWYGYAFGFPDRHPRLGRVRFSGCPRRDAVGLWAVGRFRSGAWWFENWIVDASNAMILMSSFALSRFRQALFFGVWFRDRSFCDHFLQCDDLSSGVEKLSLGFFGACAALKGVWWMPWQTVPMKDV